ncbi:tricarboxylate transporter [Terasakiispira papahanaumokuakeensis]|uniref:Tricarboxylate transporter n=1 Tax=Terasakiispira papahanaumokuakeensis TaxID=197479 RepID=A0A1E2V5Y8_9GAMM|nr:tripartite tricarboxylate transporter permease [Terasakiispira papahanaumokuakeensis]ODC02276.1 tricarboxylate transporter [Terasakiispira papahanaumokuakeensis]
MDAMNGILGGFAALANPETLLYMIAGFLIGMLFGAVPGLTSVLAIALLLPLTYSLDVSTALVACASIFMAGMCSGSITATTINIPGAPSSMMTAIEGYPMQQRGEGAKALGHAALGSMIGGTIGALLLMVVSPLAADVALLIRTPGKFSLIAFALIVIIISQRGSITKGMIATLLGVMIASVGIDVVQPIARFTFGTSALVQGIEMMPLIIGTFAISELLVQADSRSLLTVDPGKIKSTLIRRRDFIPPWSEVREIGLLRYLKSAIIGYAVGILPGAGGSMAAFVSYAESMRSSKHPERYGKGSPEGIAAAECANNSMCGGAFVPMLTFGIPGDPTTAIVLGVLVINGLQPGPQFMSQQLDLVAPMFASLFVSALVLVPLSIYLLGPYFLKLVSIRRDVLYSSIAVVALVGSYVATYSTFQMALALVFGVLAYYLRKQQYPTVCMLLGFVLGPSLEEYCRRSLSISDGNPMVFFTSPDSVFFVVLTAIFFYFMVMRKPKERSLNQS